MPAMHAMGLLIPAHAHAFRLEGDSGGKHVLILGAGLAGLTTAYELQKLGYKCTILEARERTVADAGVFAMDRQGMKRTVANKRQYSVMDFISTPVLPAFRTIMHLRFITAKNLVYLSRCITM